VDDIFIGPRIGAGSFGTVYKVQFLNQAVNTGICFTYSILVYEFTSITSNGILRLLKKYWLQSEVIDCREIYYR
jgi:hypothetical protein